MDANVFSFSKGPNNKDKTNTKNKNEKTKQYGTLSLQYLYEKKENVLSFLVFNHQSEPGSPLLHIRQEEKKATDNGIILDNEAKIMTEIIFFLRRNDHNVKL